MLRLPSLSIDREAVRFLVFVSNILLIVIGTQLTSEQVYAWSNPPIEEIIPSTLELAPAPPTRDPTHRPTHITIAGYINTDITSENYTDGQWSISATSASHLSSSAYPGEPSNIIIYGHNKNDIFGPIRWLTGSENIVVTLADGTTRVYTITETAQITTEQIEYLQPTDTETLTLYTCTGPLDRDRFIVRAVPKNDEQ